MYQLFFQIENNVIALVILIILLIATFQRREVIHLQNRLFTIFVFLNIYMAFLDSLLLYVNGQPGDAAYLAHFVLRYLFFISAPLPAAFWIYYIHRQTHQTFYFNRYFLMFVLPLLITNVVLSTLSLKTGSFFYINGSNLYARGPMFNWHITIHFAFILIGNLMLLRRRKRLESRYLKSLFLFPLPLAAGTLIQSFIFGTSLIWISMSLSLLILFIYIENRELNIDHLTGIYNRRHIEQVIKRLIKKSSSEETFAVILADLDGFKQINDQYGHSIGDEALISAAQLIRDCLRRQDKVARVGGDEFYIVLRLTNDKWLKRVMQRISRSFTSFNQNNRADWQLEISMGGAVYDPVKNATAEEFLHYVDQLMYKEKEKRKRKLNI